jgi:hypothetical protein
VTSWNYSFVRSVAMFMPKRLLDMNTPKIGTMGFRASIPIDAKGSRSVQGKLAAVADNHQPRRLSDFSQIGTRCIYIIGKVTIF